MSRQNAGVELRNRRDEQQAEAEQDVYGALERKAELYEKLGKIVSVSYGRSRLANLLVILWKVLHGTSRWGAGALWEGGQDYRCVCK
jgi:hypothetical protein